jgi:hypothetical protein
MEMIKGLGLRHMCRLKRKKGDGIWSKMWDSLGLHGVRIRRFGMYVPRRENASSKY